MKTLESCNIVEYRKFMEKCKDGAFCVISLKGCKSCTPTKQFLKKKVGTKIPILEIKAEKAKCLDFAIDELGAKGAPTVMFVQKGKRTKHLAGENRSIEDSEKTIMKILKNRESGS
jgi:hypothetical protein